jgi:isopentenyl phosphate kinase
MLIVKLGGSFITYKKEDSRPPYSPNEIKLSYRIREDKIRALGRTLKEVQDDIILVHGGGTHGHRTVTRWKNGLVKGPEEMMAWEVRWRMDQLSNTIVQILGECKLPVISLPTSNVAISDQGDIKELFIERISHILERNCVPILRGDLVPDINGKWNVISGDTLIKKLCEVGNLEDREIKRVIMLMGEDGFNDPENGKIIKEINSGMFNARKEKWRNKLSLDQGDVTKGIWGKVQDCREIADRGIEVFLTGGDIEENMRSIISGKKAGTRFKPE